MNYKEMWEEEKEWLKRSIGYLEEMADNAINTEKIRLSGKLNGFKIVLTHMQDTEKIRGNVNVR